MRTSCARWPLAAGTGGRAGALQGAVPHELGSRGSGPLRARPAWACLMQSPCARRGAVAARACLAAVLRAALRPGRLAGAACRGWEACRSGVPGRRAPASVEGQSRGLHTQHGMLSLNMSALYPTLTRLRAARRSRCARASSCRWAPLCTRWLTRRTTCPSSSWARPASCAASAAARTSTPSCCGRTAAGAPPGRGDRRGARARRPDAGTGPGSAPARRRASVACLPGRGRERVSPGTVALRRCLHQKTAGSMLE